MTTYYVGKGGNDSNDGTTWALRKLTLNGAEDIPVAAGDTVIVGPGVYREQLTCDVAGTTDGYITYEGDVAGYRTDGVGGNIVITGSDNDLTASRTYCISNVGNHYYRRFRCLVMRESSSFSINANLSSYMVVEDCIFAPSGNSPIFGYRNGHAIRRTMFADNTYVYFYDSTDNSGIVIENCLFFNDYALRIGLGGLTVDSCTFFGNTNGVTSTNAPSTDVYVYVVNSLFVKGGNNVKADNTNQLVENYNSLTGSAARTNVNTGVNSDSNYFQMTPYNSYPGYMGLMGIFGSNIMLTSDSAIRYMACATDGSFPSDDYFGVTRPTATNKRSRGAVQYVPMKRETTIMHTTDGDASLKMEDAGAVQFRFPVASTDSITASVWCYYSSDYAGTLPTMTIKQPGQSDIVVSDTDAAAVTWFELSQAFNPAALPKWLTVELRSDNTAATTDSVATYWDDLTIT